MDESQSHGVEQSSQAQKNGSYRIPPVKSSRTVYEVQNHSSLWWYKSGVVSLGGRWSWEGAKGGPLGCRSCLVSYMGLVALCLFLTWTAHQFVHFFWVRLIKCYKIKAQFCLLPIALTLCSTWNSLPSLSLSLVNSCPLFRSSSALPLLGESFSCCTSQSWLCNRPPGNVVPYSNSH